MAVLIGLHQVYLIGEILGGTEILYSTHSLQKQFKNKTIGYQLKWGCLIALMLPILI